MEGRRSLPCNIGFLWRDHGCHCPAPRGLAAASTREMLRAASHPLRSLVSLCPGGAAAAQGAQSFDALPSPQPIAGTAAAPGKMEAPGPHATGSQAGGPGAQGPGPARHEDASPAEVSTSRPTPPKASSPEPKEDFHRENDSALTRGTDGLQTRSRDASSSRLPSDARGREDGMPHQPLTAPGGEGEDDAGGRVSWSRMPDSATEKPQALDATPARGTLEKAAEVPTLVDGGGEETRDPDESGLGALLEEPPAGGSSETGGPSDDEAGDDRNLTEDLPDLDEIMEVRSVWEGPSA